MIAITILIIIFIFEFFFSFLKLLLIKFCLNQLKKKKNYVFNNLLKLVLCFIFYILFHINVSDLYYGKFFKFFFFQIILVLIRFLYFVINNSLITVIICIMIILFNLTKLIENMSIDFNNLLYTTFYTNDTILTKKGEKIINSYIGNIIFNISNILFLNRQDFFLLHFFKQKYPYKTLLYLKYPIDFIKKK